MQVPTWLYQLRSDGTVASELFDAAEGLPQKGWHDSPQAAELAAAPKKAAPPVTPDPNAPDEFTTMDRAQLVEAYKAAGKTMPPKIGDDTLRAKLRELKAANPAE